MKSFCNGGDLTSNTYIFGCPNVRHSLLVLKYKLPTVFAVKESILFKQSWKILSHSQLDLKCQNPPCHFIFLSLGHHVCVLQAVPAPARLDLVWTEVVHAAAAVELLVLAQAQVRGRDVVIAAPQRPRGDALTHGLQKEMVSISITDTVVLSTYITLNPLTRLPQKPISSTTSVFILVLRLLSSLESSSQRNTTSIISLKLTSSTALRLAVRWSWARTSSLSDSSLRINLSEVLTRSVLTQSRGHTGRASPPPPAPGWPGCGRCAQ